MCGVISSLFLPMYFTHRQPRISVFNCIPIATLEENTLACNFLFQQKSSESISALLNKGLVKIYGQRDRNKWNGTSNFMIVQFLGDQQLFHPPFYTTILFPDFYTGPTTFSSSFFYNNFISWLLYVTNIFLYHFRKFSLLVFLFFSSFFFNPIHTRVS